MPNRPKTPMRGFRIPSRLWEPLTRLAAERGETATDVVLRAIEEHLTREGIRLEN